MNIIKNLNNEGKIKMNEEINVTDQNNNYYEILTIVQDELQLRDNNIYENPAHLRDTFLKAEQEYFVHLVTTDEVIIEMIQKCNQYDVETLEHLIEQITTNMEFGLIKEEDEERYEKMLIVLTAAIRDKQKRLILEKIHTLNHGRSR